MALIIYFCGVSTSEQRGLWVTWQFAYPFHLNTREPIPCAVVNVCFSNRISPYCLLIWQITVKLVTKLSTKMWLFAHKPSAGHRGGPFIIGGAVPIFANGFFSETL